MYVTAVKNKSLKIPWSHIYDHIRKPVNGPVNRYRIVVYYCFIGTTDNGLSFVNTVTLLTDTVIQAYPMPVASYMDTKILCSMSLEPVTTP